MTKSIWLTYDLGVGGDYQNLYAWLDDHEAVDCGNNFAFLSMSYQNGMSDDDFMKAILRDIKSRVRLIPGNRIYIVRSFLDEHNQVKTKGSFIYGKRKASPWEGFGSKTNDTAEEG